MTLFWKDTSKSVPQKLTYKQYQLENLDIEIFKSIQSEYILVTGTIENRPAIPAVFGAYT